MSQAMVHQGFAPAPQTGLVLEKPAYSFRTCASAASAWGSQSSCP